MVTGKFHFKIISIIYTVIQSSSLDFISQQQISAVIGGFVKQLLKTKTMAYWQFYQTWKGSHKFLSSVRNTFKLDSSLDTLLVLYLNTDEHARFYSSSFLFWSSWLYLMDNLSIGQAYLNGGKKLDSGCLQKVSKPWLLYKSSECVIMSVDVILKYITIKHSNTHERKTV